MNTGGTASPRRAWLWPAVALALALIAALPVITYPLGRDQGEFAVIGRGLLEGKRPYVDLWNPKPPAVFAVYAAAMGVGGRTPEALRALDLALLAAIAFPLVRLGRRFGGTLAGPLALALFTAFYITDTFWTLTQNDGLAMVPMTWAVWAATAAADRREGRLSGGWAALAGVMFGLAVWFKYPFVVLAVPVAAAYLMARAPGVGRAPIAEAVGFAGGAAAIVGVGAAWLLAVGAFEAFIESALLTGSYTALGASGAGNLFAEGVAGRWGQWGPLWGLAAASALLVPWAGEARRGWAALAIWLAAALAMMGVQLKGYDYHWLPALPPLSLLAAWALARLIARVPARRWRMLAAAALTFGLIGAAGLRVWSAALPYLSGAVDVERYAAGFVAGDFHADDSVRVAELLRQRVAPGDSLFIWGFRPEVYFLSGLNPAVRFIFNFPLVAPWYPPVWRTQTVETLWAALPPYALVLEADSMPWVTGRDDDSHTQLLDYADLRAWLEYNYVREDEKIGAFMLWRRTQPPAAP